MGNKHKKLSLSERETISLLLKQGYSDREISRTLGRNPSTISRELRRKGMSRMNYTVGEAQVDRNIKAAHGRTLKLENDKELLNIVKRHLLKDKWSPEQISGRLKIEFKNNPKKHVSHETIYRFIYNITDRDEREAYIKALRRKRRKRKSRKGFKTQRGPISNIVSIHKRPPEVKSREVPGHWEGDSIVGRDHGSAIGTIVERTFRYTMIVNYGTDKSSENVVKSFAQEFQSVPKSLRKSLTYDRGAEMARHEYLTEITGMPVYFADPGSPGQRGTNENTNGLIRQFFPKKTDFSKVTIEELKNVENLLNQRPRKVLGYRTPNEMMKAWMRKSVDPPGKQRSKLKEQR
jgi:transposase, IS30 family